MGTWIAEELQYRRACGIGPYAVPRDRQGRCDIPPLQVPPDLDGAASEAQDAARRAECLTDAQEAFVSYALAICDNALEDEDVPPALRLCLAELARQGRNIQQWARELEERQG